MNTSPAGPVSREEALEWALEAAFFSMVEAGGPPSETALAMNDSVHPDINKILRKATIAALMAKQAASGN